MNLAILVGRLAAEPEYGTTASGKKWCRFRVACNRRFVGADGRREADFLSCVAWGDLAIHVDSYFHTGMGIIVRGWIQTGSYTGNDGIKRFTTEIVAEGVEFGDSRAKVPEEGADYGNQA